MDQNFLPFTQDPQFYKQHKSVRLFSSYNLLITVRLYLKSIWQGL